MERGGLEEEGGSIRQEKRRMQNIGGVKKKKKKKEIEIWQSSSLEDGGRGRSGHGGKSFKIHLFLLLFL